MLQRLREDGLLQDILGTEASAGDKANIGGDAVEWDKIESAGGHIIHAGPNSTVIVVNGKPVDTQSLLSDGQEAESLQRQLANARENLRLIEERKAQYVQEVDISLQYIKDEQRLKKQIAELEKKLSSQS